MIQGASYGAQLLSPTLKHPIRSRIPMKEIKDFWKQYSPYFLDIWQYLVILLVVIIASIVIL